MRHRFENFGGIIANDDPPFLAFVDRDYMREHGFGESALWKVDDEEIGLLSAPTEVHLSITNRCPVGCAHCYMGAGDPDDGEMDTETFKTAFDELVNFGVFHIAMGGGEALAREDVFELAAYAREVGLVPNLTISGALVTPEIADRMRVFGQANISMDGIGKDYAIYRGKDLFKTADAALDMIRDAGIPAGLNCVLGRRNADKIDQIFEYAERKGCNEIEFLRLKPSGRGVDVFAGEKMTHEQNIQLIPQMARLAEGSSVVAKIDCSFVPMLCYHHPPRELLEQLATYGCEAGNVLLGARSNGRIAGCSFLPESEDINVFNLKERWKDDKQLNIYRSFADNAREPCLSCDFLDICKGGCHAVSQFVTGDIYAPDPDCPFVVEAHR